MVELGISQADVERVEQQSRTFRRAQLTIYGIVWIVAIFFIPSDHGLIEIAPWFFKPLYGAIISVILVGLIWGVSELFTGVDFEDRFIPKRTAVRRFHYLESQFEKWKERSKREYWTRLSGLEFEQELADLYRQHGYVANGTRSSGDRGIDIWITKGDQRCPVQCKATKSAIGPGPIRDFYGGVIAAGYKTGVIASLGGFTAGALEFLRETAMTALTLEDIVEMCEEIDFTDNGG